MATSQNVTRQRIIDFVVFISAVIVTIPLLTISTGLLLMVFLNQVKISSSVVGPAAVVDRSPYYVNFSATKLTALASLLSSIAPYLPAALMSLLSLPYSKSLADNTENTTPGALPTLRQLPVLIQLLGGSWMGLWGWFHPRFRPHIPWINFLGACFCFSALLR